MPLICQFITSRRQEYGVAPICRALGVLGVQIAPRTDRAHLARPPSKRALWDAAITEVLAGSYEPDEQGHRPPECRYGATKMGACLNREGIEVARCTVERLMRANGWRGATRGRKVRTTVADPAATRAPDLVHRQFQAAAPGLLPVADFTYVPLAGGGFGYTALVIDAYAGLIPGWECSTSKHTAFVEAAIRPAVAYRRRQGRPRGEGAIHHSDSEYVRAGGPGLPDPHSDGHARMLCQVASGLPDPHFPIDERCLSSDLSVAREHLVRRLASPTV
jgi:hypothetical protein